MTTTEALIPIQFRDKNYNSRYKVEEDLDLVNNIIRGLEMDLHSLVIATEPDKFIEPDEFGHKETLWGINTKYTEIIDNLKEYYIQQYELQKLLEIWDYTHINDATIIHQNEPIAPDDENTWIPTLWRKKLLRVIPEGDSKFCREDGTYCDIAGNLQ